ncbi:hypothetical protein [Methylobacterium sp. GXF4]|uniref:hypothetical protein n=1 Tax=Methylobacterium sp. GXF4 TaxID=1096546 RepID=UPI0013EFA7C0|nr:hypothetical protein [Methylobacterium sp. GXF4]
MTEAQHALDLVAFIEGMNYGQDEDGVHLAPTDAALVAKALRALAAACKETALNRE